MRRTAAGDHAEAYRPTGEIWWRAPINFPRLRRPLGRREAGDNRETFYTLTEAPSTRAICCGASSCAGWIAAPEEPGTARIRKVFVHPSLARRGLATRLVLDAGRRALVAGYTRLMVRANLNAVPLYRRLGYPPLRDGGMTTPDGVDLPVMFMTKAATADA